MRLVESFMSVEGEGKRAGSVVRFVRLAGCNFKDSPCWGMCDTMYGIDTSCGSETSIEEIMDTMAGGTANKVTVTGGEPLMTKEGKELVKTLAGKYEVNVETNGSILLDDVIDVFRSVPTNSFVTMDWKGESSGNLDRMMPYNLMLLREEDVIKFVIGSEEDLHGMLALLRASRPKAQVYISPLFGKIEPSRIVEFMIENDMYNEKVQIQMHKVIWDPEKRGV